MSLAWGLGSSPGGEFAALSNRSASASAFRLLRELGLIEKPFFLLPLPAPLLLPPRRPTLEPKRVCGPLSTSVPPCLRTLQARINPGVYNPLILLRRFLDFPFNLSACPGPPPPGQTPRSLQPSHRKFFFFFFRLDSTPSTRFFNIQPPPTVLSKVVEFHIPLVFP